MTEASRPLKVAIAGFGTVGRAVARVLCEGRHPELRLAAIATRRPDAARRDPAGIPATVTVTGDIDALLGGEADVLVELIGGLEPARTWIAAALQSGRAVVTANKQVIAEHGPGLFSLARACGSPLRFEAAVAGAVPVIRGLQDGLAGDRVTRIAGVVNGTCNFVLGRMADSGMSLDDAVREAQTRGLAEADPAADLDGLDARAKLSILASLGFGDHLPPRGIPAGSIRGIDGGDITAAAELGRVIRQVAWAGRTAPPEQGVAACVGPALVRRDSWFGRAQGPENVVVVQGVRSGTTVFAGQGAGGDATAVAVVSDLLALSRQRSVPPPWPARPARRAAADRARPYYVRISSARLRSASSPADLLDGAAIETDRVLAHANGRAGRWAAVVRPCRPMDLARALTALAPAGGTGGTIVSLPLFDVE